MKIIISILLCLVLSPPANLSANEVFKQLTIDNGLAHTDANCIAQDSTGLIWIGTYSGLQSYDGYSLQTFDYYPAEHKIFQSHNRINALACNKEKLWIGTESGLTCFDLNTHQYIPNYIEGDTKKQPLDIPVTSLFVNPSGHYLWSKTSQGIVAMKICNDSLKALKWDSEAERIFCKSIKQIFFQEETIWASNGRHIIQLCIHNGKTVLKNTYPAKELLQTNERISDIYLANNYLFIRTESGCYRVSITDNKLNKSTLDYVNFHQANSSIPSYTDGKMIVTYEGTVWCAYSEGIFEMQHPFSKNPTIHKYLRNSRSDNRSAVKIKSLMIDQYNNLWVTANSWGVFYRTLSESFFKNISKVDFQEMGFLQNEIVSVTGQKSGTLYMIVEYASLLRFNTHTEQLSLIPLPKDNIRPIYYQTLQMSRDQRHIYIGTNSGILIFDIQTQKTSQLNLPDEYDTKKISTSISDLAEDEFGRLWIGTWGKGLVCINAPLTNPSIALELNMNTDPSILSGHISSMFIRGKYIFLCTTNGLNRILLTDNGSIKKLSSYQANEESVRSMSTNYLASIDCQSDSVCWVGTIGGGLNKIVLHSELTNDYSATCYTTLNGLPNNDCEIVLLDQSDNVWVGGNGIVKLDPQKNKIYSYGFSNGLLNNAFKTNVSYKDHDGLLYMGGLYGLSYFHPKDLDDDASYNGLIFTNLFVNNLRVVPHKVYNDRNILDQILNKTSELTLNHKQNNFTISFVALGYNLSGQVMYRYRLKGFQNEWQTMPHTNNEISYSNLPYNYYELEVQLSTDKGYTWHDPGRILRITVLPPWWWSGWAKLTYAILVFLGIFVAFKQYNKEQNLKKENEIQKILIAQDEEKYQAKMQFFMNASHELKTPLTLIMLAAEKLSGKNPVNKDHRTILHNAKKMLSLIIELVDIRKQDLGISCLNLAPLNLSQMTRQLFEETSSWAENKHIAITYTASDDDIEIDADKNKIGKMIVNLFSNAIKYTDEGGRIGISLRKGTLNEIKPCYGTMHAEGIIPPELPACILTVKDTGVGISSESIRLIYERFFQVRRTTQDHLGSGIGLAIVKSAVLQHKGMIIVSSERMVGSEFIVALPIQNSLSSSDSKKLQDFNARNFIEEQYNEFQLHEPQEKNTTNSITCNPNLSTLLIVEDNKELQTALKEHFISSYNVHIADNGRIGLEICMSIFPDIIISDVMMPEMDGIEMCRRIKNNFSIAYIPLVMLTAKGNIESQIDGYESGADLYIPKPFSMKLLEVNLCRLLAHKEQWFKGNHIQAVPAPKMIQVTGIEANTNEVAENEKNETIDKELRKPTISSEEQRKMTEQLKHIIEDKINDPNLSPDQLASALGISRTKLYRDLNGIEGQSLSDYVRNVRLDKAAQLLLTSNMNIQEVMNEVGFVNCSHFTKIFKLKFEMPPTEYKKKR